MQSQDKSNDQMILDKNVIFKLQEDPYKKALIKKREQNRRSAAKCRQRKVDELEQL